MPTPRRYPSDVSDDEWAFVAPYLALVAEHAPQRKHDLRRTFDALRYVIRAGCPWRYLPHDFPPWAAVYQQTQRWINAGVFEQVAHDLRVLLRGVSGRRAHPSAAVLDSRTLRSTPESGGRATYDGAKRMQGSKVHVAVDTLGHLLALVVTPGKEQDRDQVGALSEAVQRATGQNVTLAYVDQGYTGERPREAAAAHGIELAVVRHTEAKRGFVLLPRRWVVERSFAWVARFRRMARDYERLPETVAGLHLAAFVLVMLAQALPHLTAGS
jgi:transposase